RRLARRLAYRVMIRPTGVPPSTRTFLGAPPTPRCGVSEAKSQNPGAKTRRGNEMKRDAVLILRSARAQAPPQSRKSVRASRRMRTAAVGTLMLRDAWQRPESVEASVLARAAMLLSMRENQPAAVGNDRGRRSIVSGLLFTTDGATPTCRAVSAGGGRHALGGVGSREAGSPTQP